MAAPAISSPISDEDKRLALARVLESRTFSRSDQLRSFLRYVCEAEFAGRAQQLNEYALGVSVLGRPEGYSPAEDSSVRSRAYELRNKLKAYYQTEAPEDPVQIEIEKGAYVPRFHRRMPATGAAEAERRAEAPPPAALRATSAPAVSAARPSLRAIVALATLVVAAVALVSFWQARSRPAATGLAARASTPEMEALWKPFLDGNVPMLMAFEIRLFLFAPSAGLVVRDFQTNQKDEVAQSKPLAAFREKMGAEQLIETYDYADVGAVHAAFLLGRVLDRDVGLKHSSALGWEDIWNSNVIFVGKSTVNATIRKVLGEANLDFVDSAFGSAVRNLHPAAGEAAVYQNAPTHGSGKKYGVITVLPGPQPGHHLMILTGSGAELMWPLAQSVADPVRVKEIMSRIVPVGGAAPAAYQVVIEATFESNVPISIRYVTHHVYRTK